MIEGISNYVNAKDLGAFCVIKEVVPKMNRGGRIINMSSGMGKLSYMNSGAIAYLIFRTALNAVTNFFQMSAIIGYLCKQGCPGSVQTHMGGASATRTVDESVSKIVEFALRSDFPTGQSLRDGKVISW